MLRRELVRVMETVDPARSAHVITPLLAHFWFTGKRVTAFDDQIAISVDFKTDFKAALPGLALTLLNSTKGAEEITLEAPDDHSLKVKAGKATFTLQTMGVEGCDKAFVQPEIYDDDLIEFDSLSDLREALRHCLVAAGADSSEPERMGVTAIASPKGITLYGTDHMRLIVADVATAAPVAFKRVILSVPFVKQFLRLTEKAKPKEVELFINENHSIAVVGDVMLYGRLIEFSKARPLDFERIISNHAPATLADDAVEFPAIGAMLERALHVAGTGIEEAHTEITIEGGSISFLTQSKIAKMQDHGKIDKRHAAVVLKVKARELKYGFEELPTETDILFTPDCVIMSARKADGRLLYMVAARGE